MTLLTKMARGNSPGRPHALALGMAAVVAVCAAAAALTPSIAETADGPLATPAAAGAKPRPVRTPASVAKALPPSPARSAVIPAAGCGSPGALGVSRTVEIDTSVGHKYGHQQSEVEDFLQDHEIVLTFDDGPLRPYTTPVLKALEAHCTKAVFFSVGRMALSDPAMLQEVAKRGHTIGTHTWSHKDLMKIGTARAKAEFELGFSAVTKALGQPVTPFFRFPYLSAPRSVVAYSLERNVSVFSIDVDSEDYRTKDPEVVKRRVLGRLQAAGKGIILFHDIQPSTAHALMSILDEAKARGFKVVQVVAKDKATATTLPEFDAIAAKQMANKSAAAEQDPLASRSFVWAASNGNPPKPAGAGGPKAADETEVLPWGVTAVKPEPVEPEPRRRAASPPVADDGDFFAKLFKPN